VWGTRKSDVAAAERGKAEANSKQHGVGGEGGGGRW
jgi:hypothetical protein